ncbi:MAG: recombination protein NinB [Afipia felis]|nr:recombination protein NinB [Afipia felis]
MSRATLVLGSTDARRRALDWCQRAPAGTRLEFKGPRRSLPQNAKFWAMLTDISSQVKWHGLRLSTEDWRLLFLDALKRELRVVPNIDGTGFVNLGRSSSDLSKSEMSDLIELIHQFGANHDVTFHDEQARAA